MFRYYAYIATSLIGISLVLLLQGNKVSIYLLTILYFVSTIAITFTLVSAKREKEANITETPEYFINRKSSFNFENYVRSFILIVSAFIFVDADQYWIPALAICWGLSLFTVVNPLLSVLRHSNWTLVEEGLELEFKMPRHELLRITGQLNHMDKKKITVGSVEKISDLPNDRAQRFLELYLKLSRDLS